jgi:SAM-dependent methyltransferase
MSSATRYFAWQSRLVLPELGQRVLEVGCGVGNFTSMLLDRELVVGVDIEADCVNRLKERYPERPNLCGFACSVNDPDLLDLRRYGLDSCACLNVLEHVEDDLGALEAIGSALVAPARIVLIVPASQALYGAIDRNLGHYRRYSPASIRELARRAGLSVRKLRYWNMVGFFGWWFNSHVLKREAQSERQIRVFDRYIVPPMSRIEAMMKPCFGQSLLVVLESHEGFRRHTRLQ